MINAFFDAVNLDPDSLPLVETNRAQLKIKEESLFLYTFPISYNANNNLVKIFDTINPQYLILKWRGSPTGWLAFVKERRVRDCVVTLIEPLVLDPIWRKVVDFSSLESVWFEKFIIKARSFLSNDKIKLVISPTTLTRSAESVEVISESIKSNCLSLAFVQTYLYFTQPDFKNTISLNDIDFVEKSLEEALSTLTNVIQIATEVKATKEIIEKQTEGGENASEELKKKFASLKDKMSSHAIFAFENEIKKLAYTNPMAPDYANQIEYLETVLSIPWGSYNAKEVVIADIKDGLEKGHYGLQTVKETILEHMALQNWTKNTDGEIICLIGCPGSGKTSIAAALAKIIGRDYIKIALGGLSDESEFRGHRKTYISATPGRIINELIKCKSMNPVIVLDEIDKLQKFRGSPADALLEILDPEQNHEFTDRYLSFPVDLSKCMFICTANYKNDIPPALLDRMYVIDVEGYTQEEQMKIAYDYLLPKYLERWSLQNLKVDRNVIERLTSKQLKGMRDAEKGIKDLLKKAIYTMQIKNVASLEVSLGTLKDLNFDISKYGKQVARLVGFG